MRIRAERDDLADVLARAGRAVGTRSPLPILQGVLCEVQAGRLRVTGTDTEVTVRTTLEVEVLEEGRTLVPAKLAAEAVRKLPAGAVTVTAADGEVEITGNGPRFKLRELTVDDFPVISTVTATGAPEVDGDVFIKAVSQVGVAASSDEARPTLTGVLFEKENDALRLVATDSYRLAVRDLPGVDGTETTLVPFRALRELGRTIGDKKMAVDVGEREATFASDRGTLTARVIESSFPNYRQLLPDSYPAQLTVAKEGLLEAVGRASLVAEDHIPVRLSMHDGGVELSVSRQEVGEETEHLAGEYNGDDMTIAFNTRYLTEGVAAVDSDQVVIDVIDPLKPGLIRGVDDSSFRYLLMPVRL
ncbi:MAG TPA: DNA polymerase III subunit beta [Acidimicrobiia bacterium]|nr:DNA polymerase III subunit beta [Acidimicrobiia bacterium]